MGVSADRRQALLVHIPDQVPEFMAVVLAMIAQLLLKLPYGWNRVMKGVFPGCEGQGIWTFVGHCELILDTENVVPTIEVQIA